MKRRIVKKLREKSKPLYLEGNKGGDFVEMRSIKGDRVHIKSGCSCVTMVDAIVPNEFLSILIKECILEYGSVEEFIRQSNYDDDYKKALISKIKDLGKM